MHSARNVACGPPRELNLVTIDVCTLCLRVDALNEVAVGEFPATSTLGLVESEVALEGGAVGVEPLALDELTVLEAANVLLHCLEEDVSALTVLLSSSPVAGVDISIQVGHDAFAVALTVFPVAVVLADLSVLLLANSVFAVVKPDTLISDGLLVATFASIGVVTCSLTFLCAQNNSYRSDSIDFV